MLNKALKKAKNIKQSENIKQIIESKLKILSEAANDIKQSC